MFRALLLAWILLTVPAIATELRIHNAATASLVHIYVVIDDAESDGPDRLDGQVLAPGEEVLINIPDDVCRLRLRLIWLNGDSAERTHDACSEEGPLLARTR